MSMVSTTEDSFIFYRSFREAIAHLPEDERLSVYDTIADYYLDDTEPTLRGVAKAIFTLATSRVKIMDEEY